MREFHYLLFHFARRGPGRYERTHRHFRDHESASHPRASACFASTGLQGSEGGPSQENQEAEKESPQGQEVRKSCEGEEVQKADQGSWDREGLEEAKRRMAELESGEVEALSWDDLRQEIAKKRGIELS